jgi:hypothetical protein
LLSRAGFALKDTLLARTDSLSGLTTTYERVFDYLEDANQKIIRGPRYSSTKVSEAYTNLVQEFIDGNLLQFMGGVQQISYRELISFPSFQPRDIYSDAYQIFSSYARTSKRLSERDYDIPMQIARLISRLAYEELRANNSEYNSEMAFQDSTAHFQCGIFIWVRRSQMTKVIKNQFWT